MAEFFNDIRGQQSLALLLIAFSIAVLIAGIIIYKTRFFDDQKQKSNKKAQESLSQIIGKYMIIFSAIFGSVSVLIFLLSLIEN